MTYKEELNLFIERAEKERNEIFNKIKQTKLCSIEAGLLNQKLQLLYRKHDEEFRLLRAKYHLPPPKVISSISPKSENDNNEKKY